MKRLPSLVLALILLCFCGFSFAGIKDKLGIGFNVNSQKLYGNHNTGTFEFGGNPVNLRLNMTPVLFLDTDLGFVKSGVTLNGSTFSTDLMNLGFKFGFRLLNEKRFNPLLYVGAGGLSYRRVTGKRVFDGYGAVGTGAELFVSNRFGLNLTADYRYTTGDEFDGVVGGKGRDAFMNVSLGLNYYFGNRNEFDYDEFANFTPQKLQPIETVEPAQETQPSNAEEYAMLSFKRNQLLYSLQQREEDIKLLKIKLATLNELAEDLTEKVQMAGLMGGQNTFNSSSKEDSRLTHYRNALVLFQAGYHENAIESFRSLLRENPMHHLAGSWWYWTGESYYALGKYNEANDAFTKAVSITKTPSKMEMAQLMAGLSHWKAGNAEAARLDFEKLLQRYPGGMFEDLTKEYLAGLKLN